MTSTPPTMTGDRRRALRAACPTAALLALAAAAAAAETPQAGDVSLTLYPQDSHALADGPDSGVFVRLFSWMPPDAPLELRYRLVGWNGEQVAAGALRARPVGQWVRRVPVRLERFGAYAFEAELRRPGADKPSATARTSLVRPVPVAPLTPEQRRRSPIGVNTHHNAPWQAFARMGIHWARDYSWQWLERGETAPRASNGVDFAAVLDAAEAAGVTILPCQQKVYRTADGKRFTPDTGAIAAGYERLGRAFPTIPFWEIDNEADLQYRGDRTGFEAYRASHVRAVAAAGEGLARAGHGARILPNGDAGIHPDRAARLLNSPAGEHMAAVNFHYYTGTVPPERSTRDVNTGGIDSRGTWTFLDQLRRISTLAHDHGKEAWLTEVGWDATYGPAVGERLQAVYLARMLLLARFAGVDKVFWFFDRDGTGTGKFSSCGLLDVDRNARPAAAAMAAVSLLTARAEYAGSVDLGPQRWCLLFRTHDGGWLAAAWCVEDAAPAPRVLAEAEALDMFANPTEAAELTGEPTYFRLPELPAAWQAQRRAVWRSPTILNCFPGGKVDVSASLPAGGSLTLEGLPSGLTAEDGALACAATVAIGRYDITAAASGKGWRREWPLTVNVRRPLEARSQPYAPGESTTIRLLPAAAGTVEVVLDAGEAGSVRPAKLTVGEDGAAVEFTAADGTSGTVRIRAAMPGGVRQMIPLRPRRLSVPRAGELTIDGRLSDWPEGQLDAGAFAISHDAFRPAVRLAWSPKGLYLAARIPARDLQPAEPRSFWEWTNVELFVDTASSPGRGWADTTHQFWLMPAREDGRWQARAGEWKRAANIPATLYDDRRGETALHVEGDEATFEAFIPAESLGEAPAAGRTWRGALALQLRRRHRSPATAAWPRTKQAGLVRGSQMWGELTFSDARGSKGPAGETGWTTRPSTRPATAAGTSPAGGG